MACVPSVAYSYDALDRLVVVNRGGATASFGYTGDGQRITSTEGGVTTAYIGSSFRNGERKRRNLDYLHFIGQARSGGAASGLALVKLSPFCEYGIL